MPLVRILLPQSLRAYWRASTKELEVDAADVAAALNALSAREPGIAERILDERGRLRRFVNVFVNDVLVSDVSRAPPLKAGDTLRILPSVAGG